MVPGKNDIVLQINNSKIFLAEFNELIKAESYADPEMGLTTDYLKNKAHFIQPLEAEKEGIKCFLESKELEIKLEKWIKSLRDSADVNINKALLSGK